MKASKVSLRVVAKMKTRTPLFKKQYIKRRCPFLLLALMILFGIMLFIMSQAVCCAPDPIRVSAIRVQVEQTAYQLTTIISTISLLSGVCFLVAAFFKFDQHKKNPTQIPLSQPLALLTIAAGLCMFPTMLPLVQSAVFGTSESGKLGTATVRKLIGTN